MTKTPLIYVVIVTYNGMKWVDKCLHDVLQSDTNIKVVVIDNRSTDETVNFIKTNYPEIDLTETNENLGFGRANNIGIKQAVKANADYVFLLNQDGYVEKDT